MDNEEFLSIINDRNKPITKYHLTILNKDDNIVALGGWRFDVTRTIYPTTTISEVLHGWSILVGEKIPVDILFLSLFFRDILIAIQSRSSDDKPDQPKVDDTEPELVTILRLCYWYHKCSEIDSNNTFHYKLREIKEELRKGVLEKAKNHQLPILEDFTHDEQKYYCKLQQILVAIRQNKAPAGFSNTIESIRISVYSVLSECMFYSLASDNGFSLRFVKNDHREKTSDVFINAIASEIKTIWTNRSINKK